MNVIRTIRAMQRQAAAWRREGKSIGLVPTMGCLHEGHLQLIRRARRSVGPWGAVVTSLYVNPTQFGPGEDYERYPRNWREDRRACQRGGVDVLFAPTDKQMYPGRDEGDYSTYVVETSLSSLMEGASRPTHFRGVTTVVAKLFHAVAPEVAVFGAKDWQQAMVIRRMVRDLNLPVRLVVAPTRRERDGLAMSSRNAYLSPAQREQAVALWQAIEAARHSVRARGPLKAAALRRSLRRQIEGHPEARVDYIEFFEPETLRPVSQVKPGHRMALAVFIGGTRLIDNGKL